MGNGLDMGPNGYGPRFRPGLNYPTIQDDEPASVPRGRALLGPLYALGVLLVAGILLVGCVLTLANGDPWKALLLLTCAAAFGTLAADLIGWVDCMPLALALLALMFIALFVDGLTTVLREVR